MAFALLPARRAVLLSVLGGWLFLPPKCDIELPGFFEINRYATASGAAWLGALIFDARRLIVRPRLLDAPMAVWCLVPAISALSNGLGPYEATAASYEHFVVWGMPYWLARAYFHDRDGLHELARAIVLAGAIYVPFCLFEVRMSPKISGILYGDWRINAQDDRLGGWRPKVLMIHGLELSMFMVSAWFVGAFGRPWIDGGRWFGAPQKYWVWAILATCILCKSTGAILLGFSGAIVMALTKWTRWRIWLAALILLAPMYAILRTCTPWSARSAVEIAAKWNRDRAQSLQFRLENEDQLIEKANRRAIFGWGRFGRSRVHDLNGNDVSTTDGAWVIAYGVNGGVGLAALFALMLAPSAAFLAKFAPRDGTASAAPAMAFAVLLPLRTIDMIPNAMSNPIYMLVCGALASACVVPRRIWEGNSDRSDNADVAASAARSIAVLPRRLTPGHPVPFHHERE